MRVDIVLDIETLGTEPGCVILSIGAVAMQDGAPIQDRQELYRAVSIQSCLEAGLTVDDDTARWWATCKEISSEVREAAFAGSSTLSEALSDLTGWIRAFEGDTTAFYGNGPTFDLAILAAAYGSLGREVPWAFWQERCIRSVLDEACRLTGAKIRHESRCPHHALYDALGEAEALLLARQKMRRIKSDLTPHQTIEEP